MSKNMLYRLPILVVILLLNSFANALFAQPIQFENRTIAKIEVLSGDSSTATCIDSQSILSRLTTRQGKFFSQSEFDSDLKSLSQDYDRIEPNIEVVEDKIFITLKLWAKPEIRTIRWNGNCRVPTKDLQKELGICPFTIFDRPTFNKAFQKLKAYYVKEGFFEAELCYTVTHDDLCNQVDIDINICEGRSGRIRNIIFHNFTCKEEEEILCLMATKKWNLFTSWLNDQGTYNEEAIQHDQFVVLNYLQNEGYADADVLMEVEELPGCNRINIHITANRGDIYYFGKVSVEGNCLFTTEELLDNFSFEEGDPYSPEAIRTTAMNLTELYGRKGYIDAVIDFIPSLECEYTYNVDFYVEEGDQYRVGLIKVFGNCSTQTNVILHETLLIPGEIFNMDKLKLTEERLMKMRYFKTVNVYAVNSTDSCCLGNNYRDVHIEVEEGRTGNISFSLGFSSVDSIFGSFNIAENNFNYKGLGCFWKKGFNSLRGGGEYAFIDMMIGKKNTRYLLSWTKPYFMDTEWSVGFDIERAYNRAISKDYDISVWGGSLHAHKQLNAFVRLGVNYRLRDSKVHLRNKRPPDTQLEREARIDGVISSIGTSLSYDSTEELCGRPRKGLRSALALQLAGFGGHHRFARFDYLNTMFVPVGETGVIKLRADIRFLQPIAQHRATIPIDERLFFGCDSLLRGFRPYAVGPKFSNGDPRGGFSMQMLSAEYSRPVFSKLDVFAFIDSGHLSWRTMDLFGGLKTSIGYGVRLKIIDGGPALILGMGYPLNAHNKSDVERFFFSMGGCF